MNFMHDKQQYTALSSINIVEVIHLRPQISMITCKVDTETENANVRYRNNGCCLIYNRCN